MKNQKPIDFDVHLKYLCNRCGSIHWLSFKEASTDDFKIVCDCDNVFTVRRVSAIKIKYFDKAETKSQTVETEALKPSTEPSVFRQISRDLLEQTIKALIPYGFTSTEAKEMVTKSYRDNPNDNALMLVKQVLESLRGTNV